jgi:hypothetical protein
VAEGTQDFGSVRGNLRGALGRNALVSDAAKLVDDLDDRADLLDRVRDGSAVVREDQRIDRAAVDVGREPSFFSHNSHFCT